MRKYDNIIDLLISPFNIDINDNIKNKLNKFLCNDIIGICFENALINKNNDCPNCQGCGCTICNGSGYIN